MHEEASNFRGLGDKCDPKPPAPGRHMHPPSIQASSNTLSSARFLSIGCKSLKVLWQGLKEFLQADLAPNRERLCTHISLVPCTGVSYVISGIFIRLSMKKPREYRALTTAQ